MTINDQPDETTQLQEETRPSEDAVIVDEAHQPASVEGAAHGVLIHQEKEPLTCAICNGPINRLQGYLQAAYGPVHDADCSHQSKPV